MKIQAITCPYCKDTIFSRARYDMRWCSCKKIFIDGGFDYLRYGGKEINKIKIKEIKLNVTKKDLYNDWNKSIDKFGRIKK